MRKSILNYLKDVHLHLFFFSIFGAQEDENGEIADSPQCLEDCSQASAVSECSSAFSFGQQFTELEISWEGRFATNASDTGRTLSPQPGRNCTPQATESLNHPTEADNEPEILTSSSEELFTCVVEDSEEEGNERNDGIEIDVSSSSRNNLFLSRQVVESTANLSDNRQHDQILSNEHPTLDSSQQHCANRSS